jgi:ATP-binding cassette subfamily C (CFTR/MRP) protein 1
MIVLLFLCGFALPECLAGLASLWLSEWTSATTEAEDAGGSVSVAYYLSVYLLLTLGAMVLVFGRAFQWATIVVRAAGNIHRRLLARVLRFPVAFFDRTPTGRILNRFAHDIDQVDTTISQALEQQTVGTTLRC